jgi:hypothetical protein
LCILQIRPLEQQIDRETESQNLEEQYEALNDTNKSKLIAELKLGGKDIL